MSDEMLVKAIKDGDEKALDKVITRYSKLLWKIVSDILPNHDDRDIEECVADCFIYLWKNPDKYDAGKSSLKHWLSVVAKSRGLNKLKEFSKHNNLPLDENILADNVEIDGKILDKETVQIIVAAVKCMEEPDREIFIRRYYYEEKISVIAASLGLSEKSVESRLYRTRIYLRKLIAV